MAVEEANQNQRYEYKTVKTNQSLTNPDVEPQLNEVAAGGWRLVETTEGKGSTTAFIFERPVE